MSEKTEALKQRIMGVLGSVSHADIPCMVSYLVDEFEKAVAEDAQAKAQVPKDDIQLMVMTMAQLAAQSGAVTYDGGHAMIMSIVRMVQEDGRNNAKVLHRLQQEELVRKDQELTLLTKKVSYWKSRSELLERGIPASQILGSEPKE